MNIEAIENGYIIKTGEYYSDAKKYVFLDWPSAVAFLNENPPKAENMEALD